MQVMQREGDIRKVDFHSFVPESMGTVAELEEVKTAEYSKGHRQAMPPCRVFRQFQRCDKFPERLRSC